MHLKSEILLKHKRWVLNSKCTSANRLPYITVSRLLSSKTSPSELFQRTNSFAIDIDMTGLYAITHPLLIEIKKPFDVSNPL